MPAKQAPGSIVSYILPTGPSKGQSRPALVVDHSTFNDAHSSIDLWIFPNPSADGPDRAAPYFLHGVGYNAGKALGTWS